MIIFIALAAAVLFLATVALAVMITAKDELIEELALERRALLGENKRLQTLLTAKSIDDRARVVAERWWP